MVRNGRIGKLQAGARARCRSIRPRAARSPAKPVPAELDWDLWQGQAAVRDYCPERTHYNFRCWFEYAGGMITDWGGHHVDIAHGPSDMEHTAAA